MNYFNQSKIVQLEASDIWHYSGINLANQYTCVYIVYYTNVKLNQYTSKGRVKAKELQDAEGECRWRWRWLNTERHLNRGWLRIRIPDSETRNGGGSGSGTNPLQIFLCRNFVCSRKLGFCKKWIRCKRKRWNILGHFFPLIISNKVLPSMW